MHIRQLRIQNLACFEDVTFDFTDDNGDPCRWVVLLGENGTGKSTALQAIVPALPTIAPWPPGLTDVPFRSMVREGAKRGRTDLVIGSDNGDHDHQIGLRIPRNASVIPTTGGVTISSAPDRGDDIGRQLSFLPGVTVDGREFEGWFAAGYRPWRGGRRFVDDDATPTSYARVAPREDRFASLFDDYSAMTPIRQWIADLDYYRSKTTGQEKDRAEIAFDSAIRAIEAIFPNREVKFVEVTPLKEIIFSEHGVRVPIGSLSDGYRSAISWIGDLVRRLVEAFPKDPLNAFGVVLVDEIDLHLHPSWQRTIVDQIRKVFPNLQFVVTTHSPFIAQEMTEKDKVIVLRREGDHVTVTEEKGFVQGWRVDQILTSYLFGLSETRGREVGEAEKTRKDLLDRQAQIGLSPVEQETLVRVNELIASIKSAPDDALASRSATDTDLKQAANDILNILSTRRAKSGKRR